MLGSLQVPVPMPHYPIQQIFHLINLNLEVNHFKNMDLDIFYLYIWVKNNIYFYYHYEKILIFGGSGAVGRFLIRS